MALRILSYMLIFAATLFVGFWLMLMVSFAGTGDFYVPIIIIGTFVFLILVLFQLFHLVKSKIMKKLWIAFFSLLFVSCGIYEARNAYDRSILRIRENAVNMSLSAPFADNTKAVSLETPADLKLESDLPRLDGATALYPIYAAFAQAVYPEKKYAIYESEVACNNTVRAYELLINREVDIIFVAPPSKAQVEMAEEAEVVFRYTPIGKEAFVFFVNARNPVESLNVEQLQDIYSGEITNWKEVGGKNETVRAFQRNENSGSQTAFRYFMEGKDIMTPPEEDIVEVMVGIISRTADYANYSNAIGFSFRFYANEMVGNEDIRLLKINGIYPDLETIKDNIYPLSSQFFAISLADNDKANVQKMLDWITSEQGQYLVTKTGYCPIN